MSYTQRYANRYGPQLYTYLLALLALALLDHDRFLNNRPFAETKGSLIKTLEKLYRAFQGRKSKVQTTAMAILEQVIAEKSVKQLEDFRKVTW